MQMKNSSVFITGATGFIGRRLVDFLLKEGMALYLLNRDVKKKKEFPSSLRIHFLDGSLGELQAYKKEIQECDYIVHLAGAVGKHASEEYYCLNTDATKTLLSIAEGSRKLRCFLFLSSGSAVGNVEGLITEETPCNPVTDYGKSKLMAEEALLEAAEKRGFPVVILRPPLVFGEGDCNSLRDVSILKLYQFISRGWYHHVAPLPMGRKSVLYIDNLCESMCRVLEGKAERGRVYFVSDGAYAINDLAEKMAQALKRPLPQRVLSLETVLRFARREEKRAEQEGRFPRFPPRLVPALHSDWICSSALLQKELCGSFQSVKLDESLKRTVLWYANKRM